MIRGNLTIIFLFFFSISHAQQVKVTDVLGRTVTLSHPAKKILLGEGRDIITLNILESRPGDLIAAWPDDFKKMKEYKDYLQQFPELAKIPVVGSNAGSFSAEKAIASRPDLAVFAVKGHGPGPQSAELLNQLQAAGIPVAFIDFRNNPFKNTIPSIRLLGKLLHREAKAEAFIDFYESRIRHIASVISAKKPAIPVVFMDMKAGTLENEFNSPGKDNLNEFIELAGGHNIGADVLPGSLGQLNQEYVISRKPDIYIATGTDLFRGKGVVLGADIQPAEVISSLNKRLSDPIISTLPAVKQKRIYGLWHLFYASPFNVLAAEAMAKWFHPALFPDIDPDRSLKELNQKFLSVPMTGTYWISLDK
ncbi:MAG: ABC transporter substrate-binding protein [Chitinophagaceae bacterium]|nr:ABC transporter substrate-binding protein [Chitinophagaceae bacterium]